MKIQTDTSLLNLVGSLTSAGRKSRNVSAEAQARSAATSPTLAAIASRKSFSAQPAQVSRGGAQELPLLSRSGEIARAAASIRRQDASREAAGTPASSPGASGASQAAAESAGETSQPRVFTPEDLESLLQAFGSQAGDELYDAQWDLDQNGTINSIDLNMMLTQMG